VNKIDALKVFFAGSMKRLAGKIERELITREQAHCAIYENELQRLWPLGSSENLFLRANILL
jgi:hypothetical protein